MDFHSKSMYLPKISQGLAQNINFLIDLSTFFGDYFIFILDLIMRWIENYRGLYNYLAKRRFSYVVGLWDSSVSFRASRARFGGPGARLREICYPWICGGNFGLPRGSCELNPGP